MWLLRYAKIAFQLLNQAGRPFYSMTLSLSLGAATKGGFLAQSMASVSVPASAVWYQISVEPDYVRVELFGRQTAGETQEFLAALAAHCIKHQQTRVLISVRCSKPVFTVEKYGIAKYFALAVQYAAKIALLGDSEELRIAHQYVESLARQRGVSLRAFRDEAAALRWLIQPGG